MFNKFKTYLHILLFVVPFTVCSLVFSSRSYGLEATALGNALWNSFNIASEYYVGRAGRNIVNANQISTDITDVSGINNGTMSESYGEIVSSAQGGTPINMLNLLALAKEVDTSNMSLSELNALSVQLANTPWNTDGSIVMKNIAYGGVSLYFAVDKLGQWIGDSYDNIVAKFNDMTVSKATAITSKAETLFPSGGSITGYGRSMNFQVTTDGNEYGNFTIQNPVYFFTEEYNGRNRLRALYPAGYSWGSCSGTYSKYNTRDQVMETQTLSGNDVSPAYSTTVKINGVNYYNAQVIVSSPFGGTKNVYLNGQFNSLQNGVDFYAGFTSNADIGFQSELVDTDGVPYLVDDLGDFASAISDLYPVIEQLRELISTVPATDDLQSVVSDEVKAEITDLIDGIKSKNLTIEDSISDTITESVPAFEGTVLPDGFEPFGWTPLFDTIKLPFEFYSLFQPLFYVFGSFAGLWAIWTFVPLAILILLFIWALK